MNMKDIKELKEPKEVEDKHSISAKEVKTLTEVADESGINIKTLRSRLYKLEEGTEYRSLGERNPTIIMPGAIGKITYGVRNYAGRKKVIKKKL